MHFLPQGGAFSGATLLTNQSAAVLTMDDKEWSERARARQTALMHEQGLLDPVAQRFVPARGDGILCHLFWHPG